MQIHSHRRKKAFAPTLRWGFPRVQGRRSTGVMENRTKSVSKWIACAELDKFKRDPDVLLQNLCFFCFDMHFYCVQITGTISTCMQLWFQLVEAHPSLTNQTI